MHYLKQDIGYWISRFAAEVRCGFERKLAAYEITGPQWCILLSLYSKSAGSITELAAYIGVDKATISRTVERLVKMKLMQRSPGHDRRSESLILTPQGDQLVPKLIACADKNEEEFFNCLSSHEEHELKKIWKKLISNSKHIEREGWLK
ncbi:MAG: MarR family transcriptional regulator [Alphaproteobacteria bacterium]|jgi:DNA-binding MarR family transcriptional regulator|nr:MarR family transcriptional regulator [Alphaproteobacteria bacterium]MBP9776662.1 MarR family transcriptional regulator [Alphaproteobacteria bacterium]